MIDLIKSVIVVGYLTLRHGPTHTLEILEDKLKAVNKELAKEKQKELYFQSINRDREELSRVSDAILNSFKMENTANLPKLFNKRDRLNDRISAKIKYIKEAHI